MSDHNLIRLRSSLFAFAVIVSSVCFAESEPSYPHNQPGELFHLKDDPSQRENLYAQHPQRVKRLKSLLGRYRKEGRSTPIPAEEKRQEPKLRKELLERLKKDQEIRRNPDVLKIFAKPSEKNREIKTLDNTALKKMLRIDRDNKEWLKQVVKKHGWPGKTLVGSDGAHAAFLLVQHASLDLAFQQQCLKLMQKAPKGEVAAVEIAYLHDRVRLAEGKKQRYGTQVEMKNGKWVVRDVEDLSQLDQRRKEVGLPPIKEYLQSIQKLFDKQNRLGSSRDSSPQPR